MRQRGWAFADQESELGIRTVAVPLYSHANQVDAALNVSGHAARVSMEELRRRSVRCCSMARSGISRALGATVPQTHVTTRRRTPADLPAVDGPNSYLESQSTEGSDIDAEKDAELNLEQLRHLAKAGAEATLHRLRAEIEVLERTFPELASSRGRKQTATAIQQRAGRMSAAARKAVSDRIKVIGRNAARPRVNAASRISLL